MPRGAQPAATALAAALLVLLALSSGSASAATAIAATATVQFSGQIATVSGCTPASAPGAAVDWGDGTADSAATITVSGTSLEIAGTHTFAAAGTFNGSVTGSYLCDGDHVPLTASFTAQVSPAPAAPASTFSATEGAPFSGQVASASIGCTPASTASATVNWGDGSAGTAATVAVSGSQFAISGTHTYAEEGTFNGSVSGSYLCGGDTIPISATLVAHVTDAPLQSSAAAIAAPTAGARFTATVATFSDADPGAAPSDYRVALSWGDGTASAATVTAAGGHFVVTGTHAYLKAGPYEVQVGIRDAGGAAATSTDAVTVRQPVGVTLAVTGRSRTVGDGTAVVSLRLPGRGRVTVTQASAGHLYLRRMALRVAGAGPLRLILSSTPAAARLERQGAHLRLIARLTFTSTTGLRINHWIPIVMDYVTCSAGMVFTYTGSEQACLVPGSGTVHMRLILDGGRGGDGPAACGPFPMTGGIGGRGAQVDATQVAVKSGILYIEVGGNGGNGTHVCTLGSGSAGAGGWNGGGSGALPVSQAGGGGGGGATDVRTVSCASVCDQGGGFGVLISLASRLVVAGGGGGAGSGGGAGCQGCSTTGGNGGWGNTAGGTDGDGAPGADATISGTQGIVGGGGGTSTSAGDGGISDPECGQSFDPPPCTNGAPGHIGVGGTGGSDPYYSFSVQPFVEGYAAGGGGGGYWGGGGGDGGLVSQGNTVGGGGGGGGGSSFGPSRSYFSAAYSPPMVKIVSMS